MIVLFVLTRYFAVNSRTCSGVTFVSSSGMLNTRSKLPVNSTACDSAEARVIGISSCAYKSERIFVTTRSRSCWLGPLVASSFTVASYAAST